LEEAAVSIWLFIITLPFDLSHIQWSQPLKMGTAYS